MFQSFISHWLAEDALQWRHRSFDFPFTKNFYPVALLNSIFALNFDPQFWPVYCAWNHRKYSVACARIFFWKLWIFIRLLADKLPPWLIPRLTGFVLMIKRWTIMRPYGLFDHRIVALTNANGIPESSWLQIHKVEVTSFCFRLYL